jgi:hypothetical protein
MDEPRTAPIDQAAQCRERARQYESLSADAQRAGDTQASIEFAKKAAEELAEAARIDEQSSKTER